MDDDLRHSRLRFCHDESLRDKHSHEDAQACAEKQRCRCPIVLHRCSLV